MHLFTSVIAALAIASSCVHAAEPTPYEKTQQHIIDLINTDTPTWTTSNWTMKPEEFMAGAVRAMWQGYKDRGLVCTDVGWKTYPETADDYVWVAGLYPPAKDPDHYSVKYHCAIFPAHGFTWRTYATGSDNWAYIVPASCVRTKDGTGKNIVCT